MVDRCGKIERRVGLADRERERAEHLRALAEHAGHDAGGLGGGGQRREAHGAAYAVEQQVPGGGKVATDDEPLRVEHVEHERGGAADDAAGVGDHAAAAEVAVVGEREHLADGQLAMAAAEHLEQRAGGGGGLEAAAVAATADRALGIDEHGELCRCGNRGCLETLAAAPAITGLLRRAFEEEVDTDQVVARAREGDPACSRALGDAGRHVGIAVASLCNLVNPERIVVGGTIGSAGEVLLGPLRETVRRRAIPSAAGDVEIVSASLGERAELLGAVALVFQGVGSAAVHTQPSPVP